ncbi:hypothetical protein H4582DRAFT_455228 [Lactarius indigo]|nr:hypothetical protein H4582DRAFT_455228 [Lactarius indigo]
MLSLPQRLVAITSCGTRGQLPPPRWVSVVRPGPVCEKTPLAAPQRRVNDVIALNRARTPSSAPASVRTPLHDQSSDAYHNQHYSPCYPFIAFGMSVVLLFSVMTRSRGDRSHATSLVPTTPSPSLLGYSYAASHIHTYFLIDFLSLIPRIRE